MLDKSDKQRILKELGDLPEEVYDELVEMFIAQARPQIAEIRECLTKKDLPRIAFLAHTVKGTSANLRIAPIFEAAKTLEAEVKADARSEVISEQVQIIEALLQGLSKQA